MLTLVSGMAFGPAGIAVVWAGSLGAALAWMRSPTAVGPDWSRHVGRERATMGRPDVAFAGSDAIVVTWCEDDGGHVAVVNTDDGSFVSGPFALFPNARTTATATRGREAVVVAVDDEGIVMRRAARADDLGSAALERIVSLRGLDAIVAVTELGPGWLVVYSLASERLFGVCVVGTGTTRDVRHRIAGQIVSLHAGSAGSSAAVALGYAGADAERVEVALVASDGTLSQRPHPYLEDLGARFVAPHVQWIESHFVVAAVEASEGTLTLAASGTRMPTGLTGLPREVVVGAYAERVVAVGVTEVDGRPVMVRASCDPRGGTSAIGTMELAPVDSALRLSRRRSRQMLVDVGTNVSGPAYRSAESSVLIAAERLEVELRRPGASARVRVEPEETGEDGRWRVTFAAWRDTQGDAPAPTPSMVRLVRWVRARLSTEARQASAAARGWAEAIAEILDAEIVRSDWVDGARAVTLSTAKLPSSETTSRALTRALEL
ncbi:MAG: hypothetical protein IT379_24755 [Deltaproteobacteria bacterium]|nr:hypothetical protein [Deltaproteobacteria bacterium]